MKATQLFALLLTLCCLTAQGQSPQSMMTDALFLYDNYFDAATGKLSPEKGDKQAFLEVMQRNYQGSSPLSVTELIAYYRQQNPLLGDDLIAWNEANVSLLKQIPPQRSMILDNFPQISNLPLTSFALDLSDFLVQRTKEELNITFFYRLYDFLERPQNAPARELFPQTFRDLQLLQNQIFDLQSYLEGLQVSFQRDLTRLPEHLVTTLQTLNIENPELKAQLDLLNAFISVGDGIVRKKFAPIEVINSLANFPYPAQTQSKLQEFIGGVQFLNAVVYDGFWEAADTAFLDFDRIITRLETEEIKLIFLGLLFERVKGITIDGQNSLADLIKQNLDAFKNVQNQLLQIGSRISQIQTDYQIWETLSELDKNDLATYLSFTQRSTANFNDLFSAGEKILEVVGVSSQNLEEIIRWNDILSDFGELVIDVNTENYSHAIMMAVRWLDPVLEDKLVSRILFFGSFIAAVVESENADQVAALIETYSLPPGSSARKKHADWSLSLNSYVGVFYGLEKLETDSQRAGVYGINAPIGLALNKGFRRGGSLSLYGSIIDLGGIVAYRFNDENTADFPEITLANLFSPGVYGIYGFGENIPLSLGVGYQWGPQIREVTVDNLGTPTIELVESQGRINAFLAIDLHLLHLWNRPFNIQRP